MSRFVVAAVLGVTAMASADFVGASYTEEVINPGEVTYKIFLNYDNPLDKQLAVSGNANFSALQLTASSDLIQKHLVPAVPADVPGALAQPGDSWVTIGEGDANGGETQFSPGFLEGQGDAFGALISGDGFLQADNGGYFDSNPSTSVEGTSILIAQFTFAAGSTWTYTGTSDFNANGTDLTSAAFSVTNVPAPSALALLGLAGLGRRRRG
jgi:MYXO-CTERM domain-containing protein